MDRVERPLPRHHADFWRAARTGVADVAYRLTGSSDLYQSDGRRPYASINFVTRHDGFTLNDLVSYNDKHNEANGEGNRDGHGGQPLLELRVEGPTDDLEVRHLRERQKRNFLASLLLSAGVPMLTAGDELGRTQGGNNNAYCQDNEISWVDWELDDDAAALIDFTRAVIALRRDHPVFRRRKFFQGQAIHGSGVKDIGWFTPTARDGRDPLAGPGRVHPGGVPQRRGAARPGPRGQRVVDASFLLLFNGGTEPALFTLPGDPWAKEYELVADTGLAYVRP